MSGASPTGVPGPRPTPLLIPIPTHHAHHVGGQAGRHPDHSVDACTRPPTCACNTRGVRAPADGTDAGRAKPSRCSIPGKFVWDPAFDAMQTVRSTNLQSAQLLLAGDELKGAVQSAAAQLDVGQADKVVLQGVLGSGASGKVRLAGIALC
jgi:hypothetical protein